MGFVISIRIHMGSLGCKFASKYKNRELVRPFGDVLRFQNLMQSSCNMSFVARNHKIYAQLGLSFEIDRICDFRYRIHHLTYRGSLGQLASDWGKFASKNKNRELVRPFGDVLRFQNHLQSSCNMSFVDRSDQLFAQLRLSLEIGGFCDFVLPLASLRVSFHWDYIGIVVSH